MKTFQDYLHVMHFNGHDVDILDDMGVSKWSAKDFFRSELLLYVIWKKTKKSCAIYLLL